MKDDTRAAVRAKEEEIKKLEQDAQRIKQESEVFKQNLDFLQKLENFTGATMQGVAEKGMLNGKTTIELTTFVMDSRGEIGGVGREGTEAGGQCRGDRLRQAATQRIVGGIKSNGDRRDDRDRQGERRRGDRPLALPRRRFDMDASISYSRGAEKDPVQLEYLASIEQQSGEDWRDAVVTLSNAQPSLNAALPELLPLEIAVLDADEAADAAVADDRLPGHGEMDGKLVERNREQALEFRDQARQEMADNNNKAGGALLNQAAALDQANELLAHREEDEAAKPAHSTNGGTSVAYHLKGRLTVPSRKDPQVVEVARFEMKPDYFAKAVPVLSPRVYRLADLTNTGDSVLLPGEAVMYVGNDFVGRMTLPQVAVGEDFTVGFGVDPQLQIGRRLVKKTQSIQGGNQVQTYEFRIVVRNFKTTPVKIHVWDRLPRTKSAEAAVSLVESKPEFSADSIYNRIMKPDNLLRWDLDVPAGTIGEKALTIIYQFKLEYAKEMEVQYFKSGGMVETPIGGGMGMMGGGMGGMIGAGMN